jgi:hypothetical protein
LIARVIDCDGKLLLKNSNPKSTERNTSIHLSLLQRNKSELIAELGSLDTDFSLSISKKGFFNIQDNSSSTVGLEGEILEREYRLAAIPYNLPIYVDIVYYDLTNQL